jgi:hypothetical protein
MECTATLQLADVLHLMNLVEEQEIFAKLQSLPNEKVQWKEVQAEEEALFKSQVKSNQNSSAIP